MQSSVYMREAQLGPVSWPAVQAAAADLGWALVEHGAPGTTRGEGHLLYQNGWLHLDHLLASQVEVFVAQLAMRSGEALRAYYRQARARPFEVRCEGSGYLATPDGAVERTSELESWVERDLGADFDPGQHEEVVWRIFDHYVGANPPEHPATLSSAVLVLPEYRPRCFTLQIDVPGARFEPVAADPLAPVEARRVDALEATIDAAGRSIEVRQGKEKLFSATYEISEGRDSYDDIVPELELSLQLHQPSLSAELADDLLWELVLSPRARELEVAFVNLIVHEPDSDFRSSRWGVGGYLGVSPSHVEPVTQSEFLRVAQRLVEVLLQEELLELSADDSYAELANAVSSCLERHSRAPEKVLSALTDVFIGHAEVEEFYASESELRESLMEAVG